MCACVCVCVCVCVRGREREGGKEKEKAKCRNTKNFIRTTRRVRYALCMCRIESEHARSHGVVRIFPLHAVMLTRVDDNRTTRTENKSNVAIICRVPIIEFRSFVQRRLVLSEMRILSNTILFLSQFPFRFL